MGIGALQRHSQGDHTMFPLSPEAFVSCKVKVRI